MKEVKSELQKKLESQGWRFLTNEDPEAEHYDDEGFYLEYDSTPEADLLMRYIKKGFNKVKVTDAYDIHGNHIPIMRAVYVK